MQSYRRADDARDLHKSVDVHTLIITYLIFMLSYHIRRACSVATAHTAKADCALFSGWCNDYCIGDDGNCLSRNQYCSWVSLIAYAITSIDSACI